MRINKEDYEILGECIVTDQVPASLMADYFTDERFKKWYMKRYDFKRGIKWTINKIC